MQTRKTPGTTLVISDIKDIESWRGSDAILRLQTELSRMLSPYAQVRDFTVAASLDGSASELAGMTDLSGASLRFASSGLRREQPENQGHVSHRFLQSPWSGRGRNIESLVASDNGQAFLEFLLKQPASAGFDLRKAATPGWFVEFDRIRAFGNIDGLEFIDDVPADPGPFHAEIDAFNFCQLDRLDSVFDKASEFRNYIKSFAGIRVYRDGFGFACLMIGWNCGKAGRRRRPITA